jgi:hypothetical protein
VQRLLRQLLPPGCCYLSLAASRQQLGSAAASNNGASELLLLSTNLLTAGADGSAAKPGVHPLRSSFAGAAILAGKPRACSTGDGQQRCSDVAAAAAQCGGAAVVSLLCLPFRLALAAGTASDAVGNAGASSGSSVHDSLSGALLLGSSMAEHPSAAAHTQAPAATATPPGLEPQLKALMRLAAAVVLHSQHELGAAADALAMLESQLSAPLPPPTLGVADGEGSGGATVGSSDGEGSDTSGDSLGSDGRGEEVLAAKGSLQSLPAATAGPPPLAAQGSLPASPRSAAPQPPPAAVQLPQQAAPGDFRQ